MIEHINEELLRSIDAHAKKLRFLYRVKGIGYERALELPLIAETLKPLFKKKLSYLDIGTGQSVFPSWVATQSEWDVTCLDKFEWVNKQYEYASKLGLQNDKYKVVVRDFLQTELPPESFDVITNISVIEHFDGELDMEAMAKSARLLKPGGHYILTTPLNDGYAKDWYLQKDVYGVKFATKPVFFQRHYDVENFQRRIINASGLQEVMRKYFGDYDQPIFNDKIVVGGLAKLRRAAIQLRTVEYALKHGSYRDVPISMSGMKIYTSAGVFVVLTKPISS
ncbi:MAG: class I SAM-dependent methyltransferase [Ignavibacteria bacterium]|nr:class I SAM-dependent methyltransferase [Ignavibacteria bacterium]